MRWVKIFIREEGDNGPDAYVVTTKNDLYKLKDHEALEAVLDYLIPPKQEKKPNERT